ncbi:MAG: ATP-binding cassette domain-containing protein [Proteobacteria bacterium]|nr:ATP-binding cassette domain-containing protein [Burkholderiales bacterium]
MNTQEDSQTVRATSLSRQFGKRVAVSEVNLTLKRGEVLGFLGPNGAGKTTTMQMLTGNLAPTGGQVEICGIDMLERPTDAKARIGYLPETPPLYRDLTVNEFLQLAGRLHRVAKKSLAGAVDLAKQRCGIADVGQRLIGTLSKGYQQRVGIAQAIIHNPDVVILDEPTVGLDPNQIRDIRALIRELGGAHSVILSTHILPEVEQVCDRVQIMHRGSLVFNDTIAGLKQFRGGTLMLGLRKPPSIEALAAISGVASVEPGGGTGGAGMFRIQPHAEVDPTDALVRASADNGWNLFHLAPAASSIEDVFVQLTHREETL